MNRLEVSFILYVLKLLSGTWHLYPCMPFRYRKENDWMSSKARIKTNLLVNIKTENKFKIPNNPKQIPLVLAGHLLKRARAVFSTHSVKFRSWRSLAPSSLIRVNLKIHLVLSGFTPLKTLTFKQIENLLHTFVYVVICKLQFIRRELCARENVSAHHTRRNAFLTCLFRRWVVSATNDKTIF